MSALPRVLFIFGIVLPLAVVMGYLMSEPMDRMSMIGLGGMCALLLSPVIIKFHHLLLILTANAFINAFFLPGLPTMWMFLGALSFGVSLVSWPLDRKSRKYCGVPSFDYAILMIFAVLFFTAWMNGGFGFKVFGGDSFGGRRYVSVLAACICYFALVMLPIPLRFAPKAVSLFFLGGITAGFGNLAYLLGPNFYFLFYLFPVDFVLSQANADVLESTGGLSRSVSLGIVGLSVISFLFSRYGMAALFNRKLAWTWVLLLGSAILIFVSGFRTNIILAALICVFQFFNEGLHRTKYLAAAVATVLVSLVFVFSFADKLPINVQRTLSFLPVQIDKVARQDAESSIEWRVEMWKIVVDDIPKYFWIGKGFAVNPTDLYFAQEGVKRGLGKGYDWAIVAGDYHSGPLSLIIPFGIFGVIGFFWLLIAGFKVLRRNYHYGSPELVIVNRFFLTLFCARVFFFFFVFGSLTEDLWIFSALVGVSLSINGGVAREPSKAPLPLLSRERPRLVQPALAQV